MQWLHMQSVGNSFAVIDGRGENLNYPEVAKRLCSVAGTDGFIALDESKIADFRMHFYNRDGSRASMCGNGCRCICRFAYDLGLVGEDMTVQTDAGLVPGKRLSHSRYRIGLPAAGDIRLQIRPGVDFCVCGVPHAVVEVTKKEALLAWAKDLRWAYDCNVNFYTRLGENLVEAVTFERGVEDFTPACGTGCGAITAVLYTSGNLPEKKLTAINPGGKLNMQMTEEFIFQTGNAEVLRIYKVPIL